ncbi:MAG: MaoC family dehydratase [Desulfobacterales bacterium]|nr:MaoC family dehydratase [Desulfobacterales bacterium]
MRITTGQVETFTRTFSQEDFDRFADLTRDANPIHVDPEFSRGTRFGRTVAHGMMLYSQINRVLNSRLPGPGTLQVRQELMFRSPTFTDTEISVRLEILDIRPDKAQAEVKSAIHLPDGSLGCDGKTRVHLPGWRGGFPGVDPNFGMADRVEKTDARTLKHLGIGQRAEMKRTFTPSDIEEYAALTGDANPLYMDADFARKAGFKNPIVPGPLLSGMFSHLLGMRLPGMGTNWLKQNLHFPAPAHPGDEITASVEIVRLRPDKNLVNLRDVCTNSAGDLVCQAHSLVLADC